MRVLSPRLRHEVVEERRDVVSPVAQRRKHDRDDVEPIEQVFAKCAVPNGATEVAMRGRYDADIHLDLLRRADRADGAALEDMEQLRLQRRGHLADLIEEQRTTVGLGEEAGAIGCRARECTFDISKELASRSCSGRRRS